MLYSFQNVHVYSALVSLTINLSRKENSLLSKAPVLQNEGLLVYNTNLV